jgi:hypothetical protein
MAMHVDRLYGLRLELLARQETPGCVVWGNQVAPDIMLAA